MTLVQLFVFLVIIGLFFWGTRAISKAFGIPPPVTTVIYVILVVVAVLYLLNTFLPGSIPGLRVSQLATRWS